MTVTESGISPTIHCGECELPTTYHKDDDGTMVTTVFRCDFCDKWIGTMVQDSDDA